MNSLFKASPATIALIAINVFLFLPYFSNEVLFSELNFQLGLYYIGSPNFSWYEVVTHMFMHGNFPHILFNMFALLIFGAQLEYFWKTKRFLFFYFFTGLGAVFLHQLVLAIEVYQLTGQVFPQVPEYLKPGYAYTGEFAVLNPQYAGYVVGASGAIFGLLLAYAVLFPNAKLIFLLFPVPVKAKYLIPVLMAVELFLGVQQFSFDNIAHFAHLGGALFGFILVKLWSRSTPKIDVNYRE